MQPKPDAFSIRLATKTDLNYVIALQARHKNEIGYLHRSALTDKINRRHILLIIENDAPAGFLNFNHHRDHHVHILQVAITEELWRNGHATAALTFLQIATRDHGALWMTCRTAQGLPANDFWPTLGFNPYGSIQGPRRRLNLWARRLSRIIIPRLRLRFPLLRRKHPRPIPTPTLT